MKIAYIILAHKLPEQLVRLVRKLDTECSWFFIHIDKNTDTNTYRKMWEPLSSQRNVRFLERSACSLGNFSLLNPTLKGIKEILSTELNIDYVITLTGQDYPLKSNDYIQWYLEQHKGQSFMEYFPLPDDHWREENGGLNRIVYWHFHWRGRGHSIRRNSRYLAPLSTLLGPVLSSYLPIERRIPDNLKPFGGSAWWCLSRESLEYVGDLMRRDKRLIRFFHHVSIPSEIFYQTVLMNSPLKNRIINDDLHYIHWPPNVAPHPYVLQKNEFEEFIHTDKLFARKFDTTLDAEVLDMIDEVTS